MLNRSRHEVARAHVWFIFKLTATPQHLHRYHRYVDGEGTGLLFGISVYLDKLEAAVTGSSACMVELLGAQHEERRTNGDKTGDKVQLFKGRLAEPATVCDVRTVDTNVVLEVTLTHAGKSMRLVLRSPNSRTPVWDETTTKRETEWFTEKVVRSNDFVLDLRGAPSLSTLLRVVLG